MAGRRLLTREDSTEVTCIACGETRPRDEAREYDKHGDRYSREGKEFEYLCKPCHRECCHQHRAGLEETLVHAGAGAVDRQTFLQQFSQLVREDQSAEKQ